MKPVRCGEVPFVAAELAMSICKHAPFRGYGRVHKHEPQLKNIVRARVIGHNKRSDRFFGAGGGKNIEKSG